MIALRYVPRERFRRPERITKNPNSTNSTGTAYAKTPVMPSRKELMIVPRIPLDPLYR